MAEELWQYLYQWLYACRLFQLMLPIQKISISKNMQEAWQMENQEVRLRKKQRIKFRK